MGFCFNKAWVADVQLAGYGGGDDGLAAFGEQVDLAFELGYEDVDALGFGVEVIGDGALFGDGRDTDSDPMGDFSVESRNCAIKVHVV